MHKPFSFFVYVVLFLTGCVFMVIEVIAVASIIAGIHKIPDFNAGNYGDFAFPIKFVVALFLVASIYHRLNIYLSYHDMEADPVRWRNKHGKFFESKPEIIIRAIAFIALLFSAGKFHAVSESLHHLVADEGHKLSLIHVLSTTGTIIWGSFALFSLHVLWDVLAFASSGSTKISTSDDTINVSSFMIKAETIVFAISDSIAMLFWGSLLLAFWLRSLPIWLVFIIVAFAIIYVLFMVARFWFRGRKIIELKPS